MLQSETLICCIVAYMLQCKTLMCCSVVIVFSLYAAVWLIPPRGDGGGYVRYIGYTEAKRPVSIHV